MLPNDAGPVQVEPYWLDLLGELEADSSGRSIFILGLPDTGKTTLCRFLGIELARRWRTALVDADPGQPALGPPTTLGLAWEPWDGRSLVALRFMGATTPMGHFSQTLTGLRHLADLAFGEGAAKVVFNSSGYMDTKAGRMFHQQTLDVLQVDHLVALQDAEEMEPFLARLSGRDRPTVHRLPVSGAVVERTRAERRAYRKGRFADYFRTASRWTISLDGMDLRGTVPSLRNEWGYRNRLIALCDEDGFAIALGIVEAVDLAARQVHVYAPAFEQALVSSILFGSITLDRSGEELGNVAR